MSKNICLVCGEACYLRKARLMETPAEKYEGKWMKTYAIVGIAYLHHDVDGNLIKVCDEPK